MSSHLRKLWADESGQAMVEYGVIIAVIAVAAVAILMLFWNELDGIFGGIAEDLNSGPAGFTADGSGG